MPKGSSPPAVGGTSLFLPDLVGLVLEEGTGEGRAGAYQQLGAQGCSWVTHQAVSTQSTLWLPGGHQKHGDTMRQPGRKGGKGWGSLVSAGEG